MTAPTDHPDSGRLGLLALRGDLRPVIVCDPAAARPTVIHASGQREALARQRLYWIGETDVEASGTLDGLFDALCRVAERVDLAAAWEALVDAGPTPSAAEVARCGLGLDAPGSVGPIEQDAIPVAIFSDPLRFRVRQQRVEALPREQVERALQERAAAAAAARRLTQAVAAVRRILAGDPPPAGGEEAQALAHFVPALIASAANGPDSADASDARALLDALERAHDDAEGLLVALEIFGPDENLAVRRAGVRTTFSAAALEAAEAARAAPPLTGRGVRDYTAMRTLAIDDAHTTEVDDAFAVVGDRLYVFIAGVAELVRPGSVLDAEARARVSTLYVPEGKHPMLPSALGEDAASLRAGVVRPALALSFELSTDGRVVALDVERAIVCVDRQLTYPEVDAIYAGAASDDPDAGALRVAQAWMDAHRGARRARGAIFFQRNEVYLRVDDDGTVLIEPGAPLAPARQLVAEMMVATCAAAAHFCAEHDIPCIYRAQASPDQHIDAGDSGQIDGAAEQLALLRRLKPSQLTTRPKPHFTLGVAAYTQLTSPLRRYGDLLMHQQLATWLRTGYAHYKEGELRALFDTIERGTSLVRRVEQESKRYWAIRWFEQNPGVELDARVVRAHNRRWLVELEDLALLVQVSISRKVGVGSAVRLRAVAADARADTLTLEHV